MSTTGATVHLAELGRKITCEAGETLLQSAQRAGIELATACGGIGKCKTCLVRILDHPPADGYEDDRLTHSQIERGWRRACRFQPPVDCRVHLPPRAMAEGRIRKIMAPDLAAVAVDAPQAGFGIAVDLGTTTVAAFLVDRTSGSTVAAIEGPNGQYRFGADVVSRLTVAFKNDTGKRNLLRTVVKGVNRLIAELCDMADVNPGKVSEMVVAGNTAMHHLFLGLPVRQLALAPFLPEVRSALTVSAAECGLDVDPDGQIYFPAIIAGYVGSDHTAALLGAGLADQQRDQTVLLVDIGTNTEISLRHNGEISSLSCPSGPALEGGEIECGMRAQDGAIDMVSVKDGDISFTTIGKSAPIGLCGSAVLDLVATLHLNGIIDHRGRLVANHPLVRNIGSRREFVVHDPGGNNEEDITFSQGDIRAVQLAKAAIRAGTDMLLEARGLAEADLGQIVIAGAFGRHINISSAIQTGLLPNLRPEIFRQVGNAAGEGARRLLTSPVRRTASEHMVQDTTYLELSGNKDFNRRFMKRINFGT